MDTKLDFKIETDEYEVIGQGAMIYTSCQVGEWWVTPAQDYQGKIPPDIQKKMFEFLSRGVAIQGMLIAEDIKAIETKPVQKIEPDTKTVETMAIIGAVLAGLVMGMIYLFAAVCAYDPMLIAVLPDGRWICLGTWYD